MKYGMMVNVNAKLIMLLLMEFVDLVHLTHGLQKTKNLVFVRKTTNGILKREHVTI